MKKLTSLTISYNKLFQIINWTPEMTLKETLEKISSFLRENNEITIEPPPISPMPITFLENENFLILE